MHSNVSFSFRLQSESSIGRPASDNMEARNFHGLGAHHLPTFVSFAEGVQSHEVQVYIHDLSHELGSRLDEIGDCVKKYIACEYPLHQYTGYRNVDDMN